MTSTAYQVHLDVDGALTDLTDQWQSGTAYGSVEVDWDESGVLRVCKGTWYVRLVVGDGVFGTLSGTAPAQDVVLDATYDGTVLDIYSVADPAVIDADHVTLRHGQSTGAVGGAVRVTAGHVNLADRVLEDSRAGWGGGLYVQHVADRAAPLTVDRCTIQGNEADDFGGGLVVTSGSGAILVVQDSVIRDNQADHDGGAAVWQDGNLVLRRTQVLGNTAATTGGGVYVGSGQASLDACLVSGNDAPTGGGLAVVGTPVTLTETEVSGNNATQGGGVHAFGDDETFTCTQDGCE